MQMSATGCKINRSFPLGQRPGEKLSKPNRRTDTDRSVLRSFHFNSESIRLVFSDRNDNSVGNFKRFFQPLVFGNVVGFEVLSGFGAGVERSGENPPGLNIAV